jgi:hypothetical protein
MISLSNPEKLFWANLLIYVEQEVKPNSKGFSFKKKSLTKFCKQNGIVLESLKNSKALPALTPGKDKNTIRFKCSGSACADLLRHLRNAFAHFNISKDAKGNYELCDKHNGVLTMAGHIKPKLLIALVEQIKSTRSK